MQWLSDRDFMIKIRVRFPAKEEKNFLPRNWLVDSAADLWPQRGMQFIYNL